jgi:putative endonuclease
LVERLLYTQDVGGSSPSLPTSLRSRSSVGCRAVAQRAEAGRRRELRLGKPHNSEPFVVYVYILLSIKFPEHYYVGITRDLRARLRKHNAGEVSHPSKYAPWTLKTYVAFSDEKQAFAFEKNLKSASGRAFSNKRL